MGILRTANRLPPNTVRGVQEIVKTMIPSATISQLKPVGNYTLTLSDSGKSICGGNGTIFIPTNNDVAFPVVTTIDIVTEDGEYVIKAASNNITSVYNNRNFTAGDWIIPPRSMVKLCKIDTETWNIQGENIVRF